MNDMQTRALIVAPLVIACFYTLWLCVDGIRLALRRRRIERMARELRADFEGMDKATAEKVAVARRSIEFNKGLIEVYDHAGICRVRMGNLAYGSAIPAAPLPEYRYLEEVDAPDVRATPLANNCVNCGATVDAPTCSYCGTRH